MTLPCRSKRAGHRRPTFNDFEAALNINGNQRISQLAFSVLDPQVLKDKLRQVGEPSHSDPRAGNSQYSHALAEKDSPDACDIAGTDLDVNLLPEVIDETLVSLKRSEKAAHVFGQVESLRGPFGAQGIEAQSEDDGYSRKRRRLHGMPLVERSVSAFMFPYSPTR